MSELAVADELAHLLIFALRHGYPMTHASPSPAARKRGGQRDIAAREGVAARYQREIEISFARRVSQCMCMWGGVVTVVNPGTVRTEVA
ncbi:hypothetical protein [Paraburkholderia hospita]|uniref:hypothetical protein n=1 Tax=Paraburkholderia hospita TaxID=169430 RepID=UPI001056D99C|nr:hypothetical protein [Paraburkholderia hospita]